jgi:hypothetical protein
MPIPAKGGKCMENEESGVMVLYDVNEESAENMSACCSVGATKARTSNS